MTARDGLAARLIRHSHHSAGNYYRATRPA
jgi:hypothetical protein